VPAHNKLVEKHAVPFSDLFFEMIPWDFYDCFSFVRAQSLSCVQIEKRQVITGLPLFLSNWQIDHQELHT
jgi:hypothetical protein